MNIPSARQLSLLGVCVLLSACTQIQTTVGEAREAMFGESDVEFMDIEPAGLIEFEQDAGTASTISPDLMCSVPQEQFDYGEVLAKRFGSEAMLRLQKLLATDFTQADLTREQKDMLKVLARETVWIPAAFESLLGDLLYKLDEEGLKTVRTKGAQKKYWDKSQDLFGRLLDVAPKMPFDVEVAILTTGEPRALAGGRIFVDQETVRRAVEADSGKQDAKLAFIYAHELAHIFKRHKAKRIQQLLLETDEGLKITRELMTGLNPTGEIDPMAWVALVFDKMTSAKRTVELLRGQHEEFTRQQELEADACASYLMLAADMGDPVAAFQTYRDERPKGSAATEGVKTPYATHYPHSVRGGQIAKVKIEVGRKLKKQKKHKPQ